MWFLKLFIYLFIFNAVEQIDLCWSSTGVSEVMLRGQNYLLPHCDVKVKEPLNCQTKNQTNNKNQNQTNKNQKTQPELQE